MNIKDAKHIHFTGIKGVGMTSLALCIKDMGIKVTGSDVADEFVTDETLKKNGIQLQVGFGKQNLDPKPDLVITTGAHGGFNNPEVVQAKEIGIPIMSHAEALAKVGEGKEIIAVCGVGGKTSTCAMIATILEHAGLNPSYAIGVGNIPSTGTPGKYSKEGEHFICEADEFAISPGIDNRPRFSFLSPKYLIVTNIRHDHPDIYKTSEDIKKVFSEFIDKVRSIGGIVIQDSGGNLPTDFKLNVPGIFNLYNAENAFTVCKKIGVSDGKIIEGLLKYTGCKRRFEKVSEKNGILFYDDYAHHPLQIQETLKAAKEWFPDRRIVALFQPHTYSRTKALLDEFSKSFIYAEVVAITDIFASAREPDDPTINSKILVEEIKKNVGVSETENTIYVGDLTNAAEWALKTLKPGDVLITLGAGDIYKIHKILLAKLKNA